MDTVLSQTRLPFSIFLKVSWSKVNDASFRYRDMDSTSGGILPPRKLDSLVWWDDMVHRAALRNAKGLKQHSEL